MKRLYIVPLLIILAGSAGFSQTDTEFWFAVPEVSWRHNAGGGEPTYLHFSALDADATITIDMPKEPLFTPVTFTIPANGTYREDLTGYIRTGYPPAPGNANDNNILESGLPSNAGSIENRGVHITSTGLITVYLERNNTNNPDIWALKGGNALGNDFYVPSQNFWNNVGYASDPNTLNAIDIVATEDTWIHFRPTAAVKNIGAANITYDRYLQKGQSISLVAVDRMAASHLGGTHVWSDGAIVVSWKDDSVRSKQGGSSDSGCYDLMGDQMIPSKLAGDEYVVMRGELSNNREFVFIMSLVNGTIIDFADVDGYAPASITLGAPGTIERVLINNNNSSGVVSDPSPANPTNPIDALHIKSQNGEAFIVFHVTGFGCEMGTAVLPTIKGCTGSTEVSFMRSTNQAFYLNIMCKDAHVNDFYINIPGAPANPYHFNPAWFEPIPGTGWSYLKKGATNINRFSSAHTLATHGVDIPVVPVGQVSKVFNTSGLFHLGLINGGSSSGCRYGYFSDFSDNYGTAFIASSASDYLKYCYTDTIQLQSSGGLSYAWDYTKVPYLSNTFIDAQDISTTRVNPPPGFHTYEVTIKRSCYLGTEQDTVIPLAAYGYPEIIADFDTLQMGPDCCSPYAMKYINNSVGANKFEWTFERVMDTLYNIILNPEVVYFSNKSYSSKTVKSTLKVSYTNNCPDTISKMIPIKPEITAYGSKGAKSGCQQDVSKTYSIDTVGSGPITSIYWNWGDGSEQETFVSDLLLPFDFTHTFTNLTNRDTNYYVTLVFIDSVHNCRDTLNAPFMDTVFVPGVARAKYTISAKNGCSPLEVTFENRSNGDVSYEWSFYDGNIPLPTVNATSNFTDTTISYLNNLLTTPKEYYIYLKVSKFNDDGSVCEDFMGPDTLTVYPEFSTLINYTDPLVGCNPLSIDFSQSTTPNVPNLQYQWNFGNGTTSGDVNPLPKEFKHTLPADQNYQVSLLTTSEYNCTATAPPVDVTVYAYVDANFTVAPDTAGCSPFLLDIANNTHVNSVKNFVWDIDTGSGVPDNTVPFSVLFENTTLGNITQTITLENSDSHGCTKTFSKQLTIYPEVHALFTKSNGTTTVCNNEPISFTNDSYYTNLLDKVTGANGIYLWEFGDGTTSAVENPVKSYKNTGTTLKKYPVKLTLSVNGCLSTYIDSVFVYPQVLAQLNTADVNVCAPDTVLLNNTSMGATVYLWEFSDGTPDSIRNDNNPLSYMLDNLDPNAVIQTKVYLTASNTNCSHTDSLFLNVFPHIIPHIEPDIISGCGPLTVNLSNQSTGGDLTNPLNYLWTFGDGENSTSAAASLAHTFTNRQNTDKSYVLSLKATNSAGCINTFDTLINVFPEIKAEFTFKKNTECSPMPVFLENSAVNGSLFQWDFGFDNNSLDTASNGSFYYTFYHTNTDGNVADTFNIQLIVLDENHPECSDTMVRPITITPPVIADFQVTNNNEGCSPLEAEFTNNSTGTALTFVWDYKDFNTSANSQLMHTHVFENLSAVNKTYDVKLTAYDANGCPAVNNQPVIAYPKVVADFTFTKDIEERCTPYPVYFSYPETALNGNKFEWAYGFDGNADAFVQKQDFSFIYDNLLPNTINNYTIELISSDTLTGCADTVSRPIEVYPRLVPAYKTVDDIYAGCNPLSLEFENLSTGLASYLWNFDDEQTAPDKDPVHTFAHAENNNKDFNVLLTATQSTTGCIKEIDTTVTVYSYLNPKFGLMQAPVAGAKAIPILGGCSPFAVQITDSSTCNGTWQWNFGSDDIENISENTAPKPRRLTYTNQDEDVKMQNKEFTIVLTVENPEGCTRNTTQSLEVYPRSVPDFDVDLEGCHPLKVAFQNTSVDDDESQYYWKLGDGATAVNEELEHTYFNSSYFDDRTFGVWLSCTTSNLCSDSVFKEITVHPKPLAAISPELDRGCSPLTASLKNASKGSKPNFLWDFDNGNTLNTALITTEHPVYVNSTDKVDVRYVELIVESEYGCTDTVIQLVNVYPEANADFGYFDPADTAGCSPHEVEFMNLSNATSTVYRWDFGNETTSQLRNPSYRFINDTESDRVFTVTLNVESPYGCSSTKQDDITVFLSPNAEFLALDPVKTYPDTLLHFQSLVKPGPWTYDWDFGDGHFSHTEDEFFDHVYDGWGPRDNYFSYTVWLKAYSEHCVDSIWQFVTINPPKPYINIVQRNHNGCVPLEVEFNVTYAFGYEDSIRWNFGNGDVSRERDPYYVYEEEGVFISLVSISGDGGTFIDTTKIYVYPLPEPGFEFRPDFVMLPDQPVQFYNTTYLVDNHDYLWDFGDGTTSTEVRPWHQYTQEGIYDIKMVATSKYGCSDSIMSLAPVTVSGEGHIIFPNAFLPGSTSPSDGSYPSPDTENDIFHPVNEGVKFYELWVFNRWGEQVFYSDNIAVGWNGRYGNNGDELGQDVYFWKARGKFNNDVPFKKAGDVTLIRK